MSYEIIVESSCDLNKELRVKYGIYSEIIRNVVEIPNKGEFLTTNEFSNYSVDEYFKIIKSKVGKVKTAFATYEEFARVVEPLLKEGKDAIIIVLSSGISGTYNGFLNWSNILLENYKERKIEIIDSLKYASAIGLLAIYAAKNKQEGMSFSDNVNWLKENRFCLRESGTMDDLSFLAKNGRLSASKAFFGGLVGVQPFADFTCDGKNVPLGTIKGDSKTNQISLEYMLKFATNIEDQIVIIAHSMREKRANIFKEQLLKVAKPRELLIIHVGETCGPNIGPGLCTYFYMGSKISPNREIELQTFMELKGN